MSRKLIKTGTYSMMHLTVAVAVAFALTRDWHIALGVGIIEPMVQTVAYSVHEYLWGKAKGRDEHRNDRVSSEEVSAAA